MNEESVCDPHAYEDQAWGKQVGGKQVGGQYFDCGGDADLLPAQAGENRGCALDLPCPGWAGESVI